ncbi:hypothetical protein C8Q72DRAFT_777268 [Fomitopsis betulina]|nr:hypothetical protein C8Q72DRAFT_777268 [Fomitopsis betulina]
MVLVEQATQEVPSASGAAEVSPSGLPQKKARNKLFIKTDTSDDDQPPSRLEQIPLEILAEILAYAPNPSVILSLARCSKYFCHTLVNNPSTAFIWRNARERFELTGGVKLPAPTRNFTEASHTVKTRGSKCASDVELWSAAHRGRISLERLTTMSTEDHPRYKGIKSWIPCFEAADPHNEVRLVRKQDWVEAVDEYNRAFLEPSTLEDFLEKKQLLAKKLAAVYEISKSLLLFKHTWRSDYSAVQYKNEATALRIASREGWNVYDMIGTKSFGLLYRSKTAVLESINHEDYMMIRDQVDKEMVEHRSRLARRQREAAYKKRREDVAAHYTRLKSAPSPVEVLPSLLDFRGLSVIKVLQGQPSDKETGIADELKDNKLVHDLLVDNLSQWREVARSTLAGILGFPGWKTASKTKLHPVDRLTARFICKSCSKQARTTWNATLFEPDAKAIDAVNIILAAIGTTAEDLHAKDMADEMQSRLLCTACPAPIAVTFEMAVRHGKRHEHPAFELASEEHDERLHLYGPCPIQSGLAAKLMGGGAEARSKKRYACRHCQQAAREAALAARTTAPIRSATDGAADKDAPSVVPASNDSSAPQDDQRRAAKMAKGQAFSFDGLRSHLKEK